MVFHNVEVSLIEGKPRRCLTYGGSSTSWNSGPRPWKRVKDRQSSRADARGLGMSGHGIVKLLGRSRKMGDEEI